MLRIYPEIHGQEELWIYIEATADSKVVERDCTLLDKKSQEVNPPDLAWGRFILVQVKIHRIPL